MKPLDYLVPRALACAAVLASLLAIAPGTGCDQRTQISDGDTQADTDTDTDADTDADADADTADPLGTGPYTDSSLWTHCPGSDAYLGDSAWEGSLVATVNAVYCGAFDEQRSLEQELTDKALLKVVEGSYPLPTQEADYDLSLPLCTLRAQPPEQPEMAGTGHTTVSPQVWSDTTYTYLEGSQPMASPDGTEWTLEHIMLMVGEVDAVPDPIVLDGATRDESSGSGADLVLFQEGASSLDVDAISFQACLDESWSLNVHGFQFDGGQVELDLYLGENVVVTAPGAFTRAQGTFRGVSFDQQDYFHLVYRPEHHHYGRHFAVLFDEPIDDVCALRIENVDTQPGNGSTTLATADCDLQVIEYLDMTAETFEVGG